MHELNDTAYHYLINTGGIAFSIVDQSHTEDDVRDGDAFSAWKALTEKYEPNEETDMMAINIELFNCGLSHPQVDPEGWFIQLEQL